MAARKPSSSDAWTRASALYEAYRDGIYRFLVGQGLKPSVAQEVTQDVFLELFAALQKGTQVSSERGWLYAVAGRAVVDHWRHEHPRLWVELDSDLSAAANIPLPEATPEIQAARKERLSRVAAGLRRLSREHRLCVQLRMQGLRYREIARILGVSTSTVAEWLLSAIDQLKGGAGE
ncbi:MAG: sigma-70 family RNA polymerase sigma factor [Acidobacteriaceae bacterium]|nr:sigma-70 family RNA polymerase sigma factor [Acidobacteriaceae bacterium]MBV9501432.1 sigma-70 family RNA polymerase sigma factor [Acidobacteriaceae bacterium]